MLKTKNISVKGIILGIGFNVLASILLSIIIFILFSSMTGISFRDQSAYSKALESSLYVRLAFLLGGFLIALGMGYVAERFAAVPSVTNASICGVILLLYSGAFMYIRPKGAPLWSQIAMLVGILPLAILGGWLSAKRKIA